ncbi:hypothetical protein D3C73_1174350 [compost metagenome]
MTILHCSFHALDDHVLCFTDSYRITDTSQWDTTVTQQFDSRQDLVDLLDGFQDQGLASRIFFTVLGRHRRGRGRLIHSLGTHGSQLSENSYEFTGFLSTLYEQTLNEVHQRTTFTVGYLSTAPPNRGWR